MRTPDPKIAMLRRVPALRACGERELARLASLVEECEVPAGKVLTEEGTAGRQSFFVLEGWAAVSQDGEAIAAVGPGEFLGEMAMLDSQPRSATVVAKTPMRVLVIGPETFGTFTAHPGVGRAMATDLSRRLRSKPPG